MMAARMMMMTGGGELFCERKPVHPESPGDVIATKKYEKKKIILE